MAKAKLSVVETSGKNRTTEIIAAELMAAKKTESEANKARVALEEELIAALKFEKPEGSQTFNIADFKVTITGKIDRKVDDMAEFVNACASLPDTLRPLKVKTELDATGVKYLMAEQPDLYKKIAKLIVAKPAKTSVQIVRTA